MPVRSSLLPARVRPCLAGLLCLLIAPACSKPEDALAGDGGNGSAGIARPNVPPLKLAASDEEVRVRLAREQTSEENERRLKQRVEEAMREYLKDPATAQYRSLRAGRSGAVCGQVNGKNSYGAYVGFRHFVLTGSGLIYQTGDSGYLEAWLDGCASEAERRSFAELTNPSSDSVPYESEPNYPEIAEELAENSAEEVPTDPFAE